MSEEVTPGTRLRMFRDAAGKSRPQLAGLMGCSAELVKAIEVGRRELTLSMAVRAARRAATRHEGQDRREAHRLLAETVIYSPPARALTRDLLRKAPAASREDVQRLASRIGIQG
jgi:transcriptional regulator with XRE-family HTH domain